MTSNPLARRREEPLVARPTYTSLQHHADDRNRSMARTDIEWAVSDQGTLYLRDRADFSRRNTREIEQRMERERREWLRNNRRQGQSAE